VPIDLYSRGISVREWSHWIYCFLELRINWTVNAFWIVAMPWWCRWAAWLRNCDRYFLQRFSCGRHWGGQLSSGRRNRGKCLIMSEHPSKEFNWWVLITPMYDTWAVLAACEERGLSREDGYVFCFYASLVILVWFTAPCSNLFWNFPR